MTNWGRNAALTALAAWTTTRSIRPARESWKGVSVAQLFDKNRRDIGEFQSKRATQMTELSRAHFCTRWAAAQQHVHSALTEQAALVGDMAHQVAVVVLHLVHRLLCRPTKRVRRAPRIFS
jgi:hypothetical protein